LCYQSGPFYHYVWISPSPIITEPNILGSESDDEMDAEEEEPDTNIRKHGNKKKKKGLAVRDHVNTAVAEIAMEEEPGKKRRNEADTA
jgi:hypothetical protein